jgi:TolB-like protein
MSSPLRPRLIAACMMLTAAVSNPIYSQKILSEGIKDLATQIATNVSKEKKQRIAILPFRELDGMPTVLSTFIPEELVTDLFTIGGIEIVERAMLDRLLGEIKLGQSGVIDPETAKKVGKIASVDAIVTGSITDLQSYVAINCRLIDTQTGRIFGAAQAKIVKDDDLRKIMGASLPGSPGDGVKPPSERQKPRPAALEPIRVRVNDHVFELKRCTRSGVSLQCEFLITNEGADRKVYLFASNARLIDEGGTEYEAISLTLAGGHTGMVFGSNKPPTAAALATGVPVKGVVTFEGIPSSTQRAALIEIQEEGGGMYGGRGLKAQFRNVPLPAP